MTIRLVRSASNTCLALVVVALCGCGGSAQRAPAAPPTPTAAELQQLGEAMFPATAAAFYVECTLAKEGSAPPFDYANCPVTAAFRARLVREQTLLVPVQNPSTTRQVEPHPAPGGGFVRVRLYVGSPTQILVDLTVGREGDRWVVADVAHKGGLDAAGAPSPLPLEIPSAGTTNREKALLDAARIPTPNPSPAGPPDGILLQVPVYRQALELSCEAASLRMALAWTNIAVTDQKVIDFMGIDNTPPTHDANGALHWGDPYAHFLGDPNGSEVSMTGYGTYYPTIAAAATHFGGHVRQAGEGVAPATLYESLRQGHPAVVWVTYHWGTPQRHDFIATDGRHVPFAGPVEHAVTLVGVRADSVWVNDPLTGLERISRPTFEASYGTYGDMAVIVD